MITEGLIYLQGLRWSLSQVSRFDVATLSADVFRHVEFVTRQPTFSTSSNSKTDIWVIYRTVKNCSSYHFDHEGFRSILMISTWSHPFSISRSPLPVSSVPIWAISSPPLLQSLTTYPTIEATSKLKCDIERCVPWVTSGNLHPYKTLRFEGLGKFLVSHTHHVFYSHCVSHIFFTKRWLYLLHLAVFFNP